MRNKQLILILGQFSDQLFKTINENKRLIAHYEVEQFNFNSESFFEKFLIYSEIYIVTACGVRSLQVLKKISTLAKMKAQIYIICQLPFSWESQRRLNEKTLNKISEYKTGINKGIKLNCSNNCLMYDTDILFQTFFEDKKITLKTNELVEINNHITTIKSTLCLTVFC